MTTYHNADLHVHSSGSFDGSLKIPQILSYAKENDVKLLSITDHNNFDAIKEYYIANKKPLNQPSIKDKKTGIKIIPGVEVTARISEVPNLSGNPCKVHLLVYGADMNSDSPFSRLIQIKSENDKNCDFGLLFYILENLKVPSNVVSMKDIYDYLQKCRETDPGKNTLNYKDVWQILAVDKKVVNSLHSNRQLEKYTSEYKRKESVPNSFGEFEYLSSQAPRYERLNIEASDLIQIAHESGAIVVMAHPQVNLRRTANTSALIKHLIDEGIDGFELLNKSTDDSTLDIIDNVLKCEGAKHILITGGSDTHNLAKGNLLGFVKNKMPVTTFAISEFISVYEKLEAERKKKTKREYSPKVLRLVTKYEKMAETINKDAVAVCEPTTHKQKKQESVKKTKKMAKAEKTKRKAIRKLRAMIKENGGKIPKTISPADFGSLAQYYDAVAMYSELKDDKPKSKSSKEQYEQYLESLEQEYSVNVSTFVKDKSKNDDDFTAEK